MVYGHPGDRAGEQPTGPWVGAGVLRGLVWGELHGGFEPRDVRDVDVAYFEASDLRPQRDQMAEDLLRRLLPGEPWQAKNQAAVHTWYSKRFQGDAFAPVHSMTRKPLDAGAPGVSFWVAISESYPYPELTIPASTYGGSYTSTSRGSMVTGPWPAILTSPPFPSPGRPRRGGGR